MILPILTVPKDEAILRKVSSKIDSADFKSPDFQAFINNMIETAKTVRTIEGWESAGLAAVQVGRLIRLFVEHNFRTDQWDVYVNPSIELLGESTDVHAESCLSIPGVLADVERHKRIRLTFQNREGQSIVEKFDGFQARVLQHEYDHLDGILLTDRAKSA